MAREWIGLRPALLPEIGHNVPTRHLPSLLTEEADALFDSPLVVAFCPVA
jgi:hypothetical protein